MDIWRCGGCSGSNRLGLLGSFPCAQAQFIPFESLDQILLA